MTVLTDFTPDLNTTTLRRAHGRIPTPVAVVTGHGPHGPVGLTVGSLSTVSLDPPLMNFFAMKDSRTFAAMRDLGHLGINVLDETHQDVCLAFASSSGPKFAVGDWDMECSAAPLLTTAAISMTCEVESVYEAGDHLGVMARIRELAVSDKRPMVFYRGLISRLHPQGGRKAKTHRFDWWER